jgi:coproporphyrinogen III oxidase-like Fe-S oxidoreductase
LLLKEAGFERYEISAFCLDSKRSQHNMNYWTYGDYYGIGAGAHGKISCNEGIFRTRKQRQPSDYMNTDKGFEAAIHQVSKEDIIFEFMLNLSRLEQWVPIALFQEQTGLDTHSLEMQLSQACKKGFIEIKNKQWRVTVLGRRFTNDLQSLFLVD